MDTMHKQQEKQAQAHPILAIAGRLSNTAATIGKGSATLAGLALKGYIPLSIGAGAVAGSLLGYGASALKERDPELIELERKRKFYADKAREMKNENWLSEIMQIKSRLENARLTDEERAELEARYVKLLSK